ncbi:MAG: adenylosuccinate synthase [Planctomycetota bacterium]|jgi:adenylosuccinate synthase
MNSCVIGLQWGDEGKGKVVDILAENSDIIIRYGGGANAGHTVIVGDDKFALHILPSGCVRPDKTCVVTSAVVVDPEVLIKGIAMLGEKGISLDGRLFISENAHVVLDWHKQEDRLREESLGKNKIGTTARGIGPCYADKVGRSFAVRVGDFTDLDGLKTKIENIVAYKNKLFAALYGAEAIKTEDIYAKCLEYARAMTPFIADTTEYLHNSIAQGKSLLFEGAQGALLDIDHGTFPFVTSSNSSPLGMPSGSGVPAKMVENFIGVAKAYSTRVGAGPFPTEQDNETGDYIREKGHEYGTTTGRPRRCGWFDAVAVGYSATIGAIDSIALMHVDTLAGLKELKVCRAYRIDGKETTFFPANSARLYRVEPVYESLEGWEGDLRSVRDFNDLPQAAQKYVCRLEELTKTPIRMIGIGPKRDQIISR